jgi:hypothetical protein
VLAVDESTISVDCSPLTREAVRVAANEAIHRDTPATFERQVAESRTALVSQLESTNELLDAANDSTQSRAVAHRRTVQQRTASLDAEHAMRRSVCPMQSCKCFRY